VNTYVGSSFWRLTVFFAKKIGIIMSRARMPVWITSDAAIFKGLRDRFAALGNSSIASKNVSFCPAFTGFGTTFNGL
jgi:hypothetical protein